MKELDWEKLTAAHPGQKAPARAAFEKAVAARAEAAGGVEQLSLEDLYLAAGVLEGDAAAVKAFRALLSRRVAQVLKTMRAPGTMQDEVLDVLFEKLCVGSKTAPARLSGYAGRGALAAWLGAAATRTAIELKRLRRYGEDHEEGDAASLKVAAADPELKLLQSSQAERFKAALHEAFESLTVEDRNLLRMQLADEMTVDQLGTVFQVHRATAARWVARAREKLLERVRAVLQRRFRMSDASVASELRAFGPNLDLSLSRLLQKLPSHE